jgi:hypothetical protein
MKDTKQHFLFQISILNNNDVPTMIDRFVVLLIIVLLHVIEISPKVSASTSSSLLTGLLSKIYPKYIPLGTESRVTSFLYVPDSQQDSHINYSWNKIFRESGGIFYKQAVLNREELSLLRNELSKLRWLDETTSSVARKRKGAVLHPTSDIVQRILKKGSVSNLVNKVMRDPPTFPCEENLKNQFYKISPDIPVEIRLYETPGAGMDWHTDDVLYRPIPQLEVIVTIENNSDCVTCWRPQRAIDEGSIERVETEPGSVLLLQAGGVPHCVTPLSRGRRVILKCAYILDDALHSEGHVPKTEFYPQDMVPQFLAPTKKIFQKRKKKHKSQSNKQ